jgi:hypothetical protein
VHAEDAARRGADFAGGGLPVAAWTGSLAQGGEVLAGRSTFAAAPDLPRGEPLSVELKNLWLSRFS